MGISTIYTQLVAVVRLVWESKIILANTTLQDQSFDHMHFLLFFNCISTSSVL